MDLLFSYDDVFVVKSWVRASKLEFSSYIRLMLEPRHAFSMSCSSNLEARPRPHLWLRLRPRMLVWTFDPNYPILKVQIGRTTLYSPNKKDQPRPLLGRGRGRSGYFGFKPNSSFSLSPFYPLASIACLSTIILLIG